MKQFIFILALALSFGTTESKAQSLASFFDEADAIFGKFTSGGKVDYKAIKADPTMLNKALETSSKIRVSPNNSSNYQAFWINAYNLAVIKGIVDNYPLNSPLDVKGFFDTTTFSIGGRSITLNDIENKMLRAKYDEPRFHFVLVCGAIGCPPIISEAYRPSTLERQLQAQTVKALNDPKFIKVSEGKIALSEIFKWYKVDFVKENQTEIDFLNKYRKDKLPAESERSYYSYNWNLNSK